MLQRTCACWQRLDHDAGWDRRSKQHTCCQGQDRRARHLAEIKEREAERGKERQRVRERERLWDKEEEGAGQLQH